jgi:hypothetical protein
MEHSKIIEIIKEEVSKSWAKFAFPDRDAYHEAIRILQDYNFRAMSGEPPVEGRMYYKADDHRSTMAINSDNSDAMEQVLKSGGIQYKRDVNASPAYQIFNQGGYLD